MNGRGPKYNAEGYRDPTGYFGTKAVIKEESAEQRRVSALVQVLKYIIDKSGFIPINRIELRDKKSGKEYR